MRCDDDDDEVVRLTFRGSLRESCELIFRSDSFAVPFNDPLLV